MKIFSMLAMVVMAMSQGVTVHAESAIQHGAKAADGSDVAPLEARPEGKVAKADEGPRLVDATGNFSYVIPPNWAPKDYAGSKFKFCADAPHDGFASNFYVVDEAFTGELAEYLRLNADAIVKMLPKCVVISKGDFVTNAGLAGKILTVEDEQFEKQLRQSFYIFPNGKGTMMLVTATCLAKDAATYKPVFDKAMKTFRFDK